MTAFEDVVYRAKKRGKIDTILVKLGEFDEYYAEGWMVKKRYQVGGSKNIYPNEMEYVTTHGVYAHEAAWEWARYFESVETFEEWLSENYEWFEGVDEWKTLSISTTKSRGPRRSGTPKRILQTF